MERQPEHLVSDKMKIQIMTDALRKLACLGSGNNLGNSDGNIIAQRALVRSGVGFDDPVVKNDS